MPPSFPIQTAYHLIDIQPDITKVDSKWLNSENNEQIHIFQVIRTDKNVNITFSSQINAPTIMQENMI